MTKEDLIKKARETFSGLSTEEMRVLAGESSSEHEAVERSNVYLTPRALAKYWMPALPGNAVKVLNYLVYKTYGWGKEETGDYISWSQLIDGTVTKDSSGKIKQRHDWGCGVSRSKLSSALTLLEVLGLIEVERNVDELSGKKETSKYRIKVNDWSKMNDDEKQYFMSKDPFVTVKAATKTLKEIGLYDGSSD